MKVLMKEELLAAETALLQHLPKVSKVIIKHALDMHSLVCLHVCAVWFFL